MGEPRCLTVCEFVFVCVLAGGEHSRMKCILLRMLRGNVTYFMWFISAILVNLLANPFYQFCF